MLCEPQYNDEDQVIGVGPSSVPWSRCAAHCCGRTVQLQMRTRMAYGVAVFCAAYMDTEGERWTGMTSERETELWKSLPPPPQKVRSCTERTIYNSGSTAIKTSSDPLEEVDCEGEPVDVQVEPEDCFEGDDWDDPRPQTPVISYEGETGSLDDLLTSAIGATAWGDWSEWETLGEVSSGGALGMSNLNTLLAEGGRGQSGSGYGAIASAWRVESELRILGDFSVSVSISSGVGLLGELPVTPQILQTGVPASFTVDAPSPDEEWISPIKVLRCVCPAQFAPTP